MEVFLLDADISRKLTYPVQPVVEEVDDDTRDHEQYARCNNIFACICIHAAKVKSPHSKNIRMV